MYTIKHAAESAGLTPATLRAWERRYNIVTPHRTEAGYRLYDEAQVEALRVMSALVHEGWSPRQAADETRRRGTARRDSSTVAEVGLSAPVETVPESRERGVPTSTGIEQASDPDALVRAAAHNDPRLLASVLDEQFSRGSFESVVDGWLMPALVALGNAWADGRVSVAGEHLVANAVMRRLAAAYEASSSGGDGPAVVVGLPPGVRHEIGVLAFAVAARRAGLRADYLGADLPTTDWVHAVTAHGARAVVLSLSSVDDLPALTSVARAVHQHDPRVLVAVGGALQALAPDDCLRLGDEIGGAVARLAATLDSGG